MNWLHILEFIWKGLIVNNHKKNVFVNKKNEHPHILLISLMIWGRFSIIQLCDRVSNTICLLAVFDARSLTVSEKWHSFIS